MTRIYTLGRDSEEDVAMFVAVQRGDREEVEVDDRGTADVDTLTKIGRFKVPSDINDRNAQAVVRTQWT